jgi:FlaA1/EpsC-like NDP-sugar epimerase
MIATLLRFNFDLNEVDGYDFFYALLFASASSITATIITRSYSGIVRYTGIEDGIRLFFTCILIFFFESILNLIWFYQYRQILVPFSIICISFFVAYLLLFFYRVLVKNLFQLLQVVSVEAIPVAIYGTTPTGIITNDIINKGTRGRYRSQVFFEKDSAQKNKQINGIWIYDFDQDFERIVASMGIRELILTRHDLSFEQKNNIVDSCLKNRIRIKSIPPVENWVHGELSINQIRDISMEDLLGRESITIPSGRLEKSLRSAVVCVTGAAGSIGSELCRQILSFQPERMILIDQSESGLYDLELELTLVRGKVDIQFVVANINNAQRMEYLLGEYRPDILYHAAAYKHVPMMEKNPIEAVQVNILGTKLLADLSVRFGIKRFIMVSTDKAINPSSVMGCSKRIAEIYVQSMDHHQRIIGGATQFIITRFGNVLGSSGSVVPIFQRQIKAGGPVTVTDPEVMRYFMSIPEACRLVLEAGSMGSGGEIFIFDMGKPVRIVDLARKMIMLSGYEPDRDIRIVFTGLRDGEKLFEELLHHSENTLPTYHEKIMKARVQEYSYSDVILLIELFNDLVIDRNELKLLALMKEIVPEFRGHLVKP